MLDVWLFYGYIAILLFWGSFSRLRRAFPKVPLDPTQLLPSLEANQVTYRRRVQQVTFFWLASLGLAFYFWYKDITWIPGQKPGFNGEVIAALIAVFALGHVAGCIWWRQASHKLVRARPEFADSVDTAGMAVLGASITAVPMTILVIGILVPFDFAGLEAGLLGACFSFILLSKLRLKLMVKRQATIAAESPLGAEVSAMLNAAGIQPKRLIRLRSLLANGYALKDGTISVTTMMASLSSPRETSAVLAHELSHSIDKDVAKLQRTMIMIVVIVGSGFMALLFGFDVGLGRNPYELAAGLATFAVILRPLGCLYSRVSRPLEFKCDAYAVKLGYGPELIAALRTLHQVMGLPSQWSGIDKLTLTHPGLDDRIKAIEALAAPQREP